MLVFIRSAEYITTETETNPIDRSIAHLLFHRWSETDNVNWKCYITWIAYDCKFLIVNVDLATFFCAIEIFCFSLLTLSCNRMNIFMVTLQLPGSNTSSLWSINKYSLVAIQFCRGTYQQYDILVLQPLLPHGRLPLLCSVIWVVSEGWTGFYAVIYKFSHGYISYMSCSNLCTLVLLE